MRGFHNKCTLIISGRTCGCAPTIGTITVGQTRVSALLMFTNDNIKNAAT